jgi:hypothetical protein
MTPEKRFALYPYNSNSLAIVSAVEGTFTEEERPAPVPEGVPFAFVNAEAFPSDATFRDAWEYDFTEPNGSAQNVSVNLDKAKEIHKGFLRMARKPLLEQLDIEMFKLQEVNLPTTEVATKKQILRDITQTTELSEAQTPEEVKLSWPSEILGNSPYSS